MTYTLKKLNVVKLVDRADKKAALLAQGFTDITQDNKKPAAANKKPRNDNKNSREKAEKQ